MEYDRNLDCTGVYCPMPIIQAKREIDTMSGGQVLRVAADDPGRSRRVRRSSRVDHGSAVRGSRDRRLVQAH